MADTGTGKAHQDRMPVPQGAEEVTARKGARGKDGPTPMAAVEGRPMELRTCPKYTSVREVGEAGEMMMVVIKGMAEMEGTVVEA